MGRGREKHGHTDRGGAVLYSSDREREFSQPAEWTKFSQFYTLSQHTLSTAFPSLALEMTLADSEKKPATLIWL